jgi:hypothetical protein
MLPFPELIFFVVKRQQGTFDLFLESQTDASSSSSSASIIVFVIPIVSHIAS